MAKGDRDEQRLCVKMREEIVGSKRGCEGKGRGWVTRECQLHLHHVLSSLYKSDVKAWPSGSCTVGTA